MLAVGCRDVVEVMLSLFCLPHPEFGCEWLADFVIDEIAVYLI